MGSESHTGFPAGLAARGVAASRARSRRGPGRPRLRVIHLFVDGVPRLRVYVTAGGMVDVAIRELGARLIEVEPLADGPLPLAAQGEEADEL